MPELPSVGVHPTSTDQSMPVLELAKETEARGLTSLYLPEHTHVPVGSNFLPGGHEQPVRYRRTLDPYVASAYIAAVTNLEVGTGISLVAQHDAIALAKAIATLDHLAAGRVVIGVGFGYNRREAEDHGFPAAARAQVVEETVRLMRQLWTQDEGEFEGEYRRVSPSWAWPKPVQPGGPPILLGVRGTPRNFARIVEWCDGWIPMGLNPVADPEMPTQLDELRQRWSDAGRSGSPAVCSFFDPLSVDEIAHFIERGAELGVQRLQVFLEDRGRDDALPILDRVAAAVVKVAGR